MSASPQLPSASAPPCVAAPDDAGHWFNTEVHAHDQQLKSYLRGSFPAVRDVDDVVQESYLRVWKRHAANPITSAKAFLFTVARRLAIDFVRHQKHAATEPVEDLSTLAVYDEGSSAAESASRAEMIQLLIEAVDALPARCRDVVILRKFKYLSTRETALQLGIREHTVDIQLNRANARIRAWLEARGVKAVLGHEA